MRTTLPESVKVVVPSRNRAAWLATHKKFTLRTVSHLKPALFVRGDDPQFDAYVTLADEYGVDLEVQPHEGCFGVSQAYDMLIDRAIEGGYDKLLILDDDMHFKMWNPIIGAKPDVKFCSQSELTELMCQWTDALCPQMPATCLLPVDRRTQDALLRYASPLMWCYGFYLPHFRAHPEHRFYKGRELEARCDHNLALQLLTSGFLTAYFCPLIIPSDVNNPGGCSTYRSLEVEHASTDALLELYPGIVRQVIKVGWLDDPTAKRRSVEISWKRAFSAAKFQDAFGEAPSSFKLRALRRVERAYGALIEELRHGA